MEKNIIMKKIFVSAYACEPGLGSEIGVGWHWVLELSKYYEVWVLTRESNRGTIVPWIEQHREYENIHFVYFDLPQWARRWKRGMRGVRIYYMLWQWLSNGVVKRTMQENGIETYHHLTYGNAMWPVSRYGMKQRFVWGPTSAGVSLPRYLTKNFSWKSRLKEVAQRWMKRLLPLNVGFRRRCRCAEIILCKTDETIECVPRKWRHKCVQMTDVAVEPRDASRYMMPKRYDETKVNYVATGTLVGWRTMDVLIDAWAAMSHTEDLSLTERTERTEFLSLRDVFSPTDDTDNTDNSHERFALSLREKRSTDDTDFDAVDAPAGNFLAFGSKTVGSQFSILNFIAKGSKTFGSQLTIVGDGPERGRLERLVDELGVRDSVRFVGQVDMETYYSYIAQADVVVNPCFREGAVTVSFDSMAMGKPLICFDTGGYTHSFEPGYSRVIKGVTSRQEAVERLAQAMVELADKELCAKMGAEAKRRSEELSWEKKIESIVNSQHFFASLKDSCNAQHNEQAPSTFAYSKNSTDNSPVGTT